MNITVLSDLDDTLISTNMDQYFPNYFTGLGNALKDLGSTNLIQKQVFYAVEKMGNNQDPGKLLSEIFAENFYAPLGTTEAAQKDKILHFYHEEYPKFKDLTTVRPEALEFVEWCRKQNILIAIATNPVFPDIATRARVVWAGLDPAVFPFFTTYEHFHFTKPNMTYYAECLGRLGWPEGKIVMIGDDPVRDIEPMQAMGFPTFQIRHEKNNHNDNEGTIAEVKNWLEGIAKQPNAEPQFSPEANLAIMRSTPAVMDYWMRYLPSEAFNAKSKPTEWNLTEIFWHLADFENEVYLPQWKQLAADPSVQLTVPETSRWAKERAYHLKDPKDAYQKFYQGRMASLEILNSLIEKGLLDQPIQHTVFSQPTLAELISFVSRHDRVHLRQSSENMNI